MNRKQGFTLVELIVAIGLMTMLVTILATILQSAQEMYDVARIRANIEANGKNAVETLEKDMSKLVTLSNDYTNYEFIMRSKPWDNTIGDNAEQEQQLYLDTENEPTSGDKEEIDSNCILSFFASANYYDSVEKERVYKVCRIQYYLKRRNVLTIEGLDPSPQPGAYLIRRIEPIEYNDNGELVENDPIEEDICTYVRGVRLWFYDRDADVTDKDVKFIEATKTEDSFSNPIADDKYWDSTNECVKFKMQEDWNTSLEEFDSQHFLPPAIMIELHVIDGSANAYRIVRKIINIPVSPTILPTKPTTN